MRKIYFLLSWTRFFFVVPRAALKRAYDRLKNRDPF